MKRNLIAVLGLAALWAAGCGGKQPPRLNAGGATFVYPMMSKWASEYDTEKGVQVNYQSIGSGGGIQQMTAKTFDFGCTDGPMNEEQLQKARQTGGEVLHIPLVLGGGRPGLQPGGGQRAAPLHRPGPGRHLPRQDQEVE